MKTGALHVDHPGVLGVAAAMLTNLPLLAGYALYGLSTVLLILALRDGELSLLYPVIALTYVWVTVLSFLIFHESINPLKMAGIAIIVSGVTVLGRNGK
jgi:multidrug transporter EmrE-like cation transporter